ncbi:MAG: universal stress protein [Gillisia sp.]
MKNIKNIVVAIDFNDVLDELISYAEGIGKKFNSKIWVIHVEAPDPDFVGFEAGPQYIRDFKASEMKEEHKKLQKISQTLTDRDLESEALLIQGSTVETVIAEAEKLKADLLIVGTHKHSFFHDLLSENVSLELLKNGRIPLLCIPVTAKEEK